MALFGKKDEKNQQAKSEQDDVLAIAEKGEQQPKTETVKSKEDTGDAYLLLVKPMFTEKSYKQANLSKFTFKVHPKANKVSVAKAIEKVYDVHVLRVNMVNVRGKGRNFGRAKGRTSDWKKAIITLKQGETIPGLTS